MKAMGAGIAVASIALGLSGCTELSAHGIIDWNSGTALLRDGSSGIAGVTRLNDGQIEVVFSDPDYESLKSTVIVSLRRAVPASIAWDTYGANSVQVRVWLADGSPAPAGSFSILLVDRPGEK